MDLIYTNAQRVDQGILTDCTLDLAYGSDENDFELTVSVDGISLEAGSVIYMEGTEYGGIVDGIRYVSDDKQVNYTGRTWHGVLNSKIIQPDSGADYYTVSGDANTILSTLISRLGLSDLFVAETAASGIFVSSYQFTRYAAGYDGLCAMLSSVGAKIHLEVLESGKVQLSALLVANYTTQDEWDSDQMSIDATKAWTKVNHLICLGKGDLANRQVLHLYAGTNGTISATQSLVGLDEYMAVYDYSNAESEAELLKSGTEKLMEYQAADSCKASITDETVAYDIGDIVGVTDNITGLSVETAITKKIVTISGGVVTVSYKTGSD